MDSPEAAALNTLFTSFTDTMNVAAIRRAWSSEGRTVHAAFHPPRHGHISSDNSSVGSTATSSRPFLLAQAADSRRLHSSNGSAGGDARVDSRTSSRKVARQSLWRTARMRREAVRAEQEAGAGAGAAGVAGDGSWAHAQEQEGGIPATATASFEAGITGERPFGLLTRVYDALDAPPYTWEVEVEVPADQWHAVADAWEGGTAAEELRLSVVSVLFTQGINEQQSVANTFLGDTSMQTAVNDDSWARLHAYALSCLDLRAAGHLAAAADPAPVSEVRRAPAAPHLLAHARSRALSRTDAQLRRLMHAAQQYVEMSAAERRKIPEVLTSTADLVRALGGARVTMCKSAKDRTSMAVTLETVRVPVRSCAVFFFPLR